MTNVFKRNPVEYIEWNVKGKLDSTAVSDSFSFQNRECQLEFYFGNKRYEYSRRQSYTYLTSPHLYLKTSKALQSPVTVKIRVSSNDKTFETEEESITTTTGNTQIWTYSKNSLEYKLLTVHVTICGDSSKNPMIKPICMDSLSEDYGKLLENREHSDVVLKCGEKAFPAHRNILSARSDVFSAMFRNKMSESKSGIVNIEDIEPNILEYFLRYVYSGNIKAVNRNTAISLYKIADKYSIPSLKRKCGSLIEADLTKDAICPVLLLADQYHDDELSEATMLFALNAKDLLESKEWDVFSDEHPHLAVKVYKMFKKNEVNKK